MNLYNGTEECAQISSANLHQQLSSNSDLSSSADLRLSLFSNYYRVTMEDANQCSVCCHSLSDGAEGSVSDRTIGVCAPCGHVFHTTCYGKWERYNRHRNVITCPTCKANTHTFCRVFLDLDQFYQDDDDEDDSVSSFEDENDEEPRRESLVDFETKDETISSQSSLTAGDESDKGPAIEKSLSADASNITDQDNNFAQEYETAQEVIVIDAPEVETHKKTADHRKDDKGTADRDGSTNQKYRRKYKLLKDRTKRLMASNKELNESDRNTKRKLQESRDQYQQSFQETTVLEEKNAALNLRFRETHLALHSTKRELQELSREHQLTKKDKLDVQQKLECQNSSWQQRIKKLQTEHRNQLQQLLERSRTLQAEKEQLELKLRRQTQLAKSGGQQNNGQIRRKDLVRALSQVQESVSALAPVPHPKESRNLIRPGSKKTLKKASAHASRMIQNGQKSKNKRSALDLLEGQDYAQNPLEPSLKNGQAQADNSRTQTNLKFSITKQKRSFSKPKLSR